MIRTIPPYKQKKILFFFLIITTAGLSQTKEDIQKIVSSYDLPKLKQMEQAFSKKYESEKKKALDFAKKNNLPLTKTTKEGAFQELQSISPDGAPIYYTSHANEAIISTRVNYLHLDGGLGLNVMGQNMTAYVWDGGHARITHGEYDGLGGDDRVSIADAAGEGGIRLLDHSGGVVGIICASGYYNPSAAGMAPYSKVKSYKWTNALAEMAAAAADGMLISNHSYDIGPEQGSYSQATADYDNLFFNAPYYLMVCSAGNSGTNGTTYRLFSGMQLCKNNITVGNTSDASIDSFGNYISAFVYGTSSFGPTDELRIKPDLTGNGVTTVSTGTTGDFAYTQNLGATSFAAPNISGSLLLLQQHHKEVTGNFMKAATLKGLALHTADDVLPTGPDAGSGWGLLNAKKAAETISRNGTRTIINELTLTSGQSYSINVTSDEINKLMASISWTDAPGIPTSSWNSTSSKLVNDLDIRITKAASTFFPYKLTSNTTYAFGDNTVDPYERVDVLNPSGMYTITVTHKGSLASGSQNFSLIVTGISNNCTVTVPTDLSYFDATNNTVSLRWNNSVEGFYTIRYKIVGAPSWTSVNSPEKFIKITGLNAFTNYEVQIQSICPGGLTSNFSNSMFFTTAGTYCSAIPAGRLNIFGVELNTINKISMYDSNVNYESFTNLSTKLVKTETNTIRITTDQGNSGVAVWIDYNRNGVFTDSGELVFSQSSSTSSIKTGTFIVPALALEGGTRMRVAIKVNGIPNPCETNYIGKVEDYTVIIKNTACSGQTIWNGSAWSNGNPNNAMEAIISGNYSGNGFSACTLTVNGNAQVVIPSGQNLVIEGLVSVANTASLTLENNVNLLQSKSITNIGNIKIRRSTAPLKRLDYAMWTSPVGNQNLQNFSPQTLSNRFYTYNPVTNLYNTIAPSSNSFSTAVGYLIRMPNNHPTIPTVWTGEFNGIPNNGNYVINVPEYSYVATGNPYPSAMDLHSFILENQAFDAIYFWRKENNDQVSSYTTYTAGLGAVINSGDPNKTVPGRYIPVGQGFIVATNLQTFTFRNNMRVLDNRNVFLKTTQETTPTEKHTFHLSVTSNNGISSNMMLGYVPDATSGIDPFIDGRYINDSQNALTSLIDGEEFTLQGRGLPFSNTDEVPLGFKTQLTGDYSLSITALSGLFIEDQDIFVEDMLNGITHNLKESAYSFSSNPGVFNNRFKIKYQNNSLGITENVISGATIYHSDGFLHVISKKEIDSFSIYDMMGRLLIREEKIQSTTVKKDLYAIAKQCLIVKVILTDGSIVSGKITN